MSEARKKAFITGASSGIGAEFARHLARDGYDLVLHGRRENLLRDLCAALSSSHGITAEYCTGELGNPEDRACVVGRLRAMGQVDLLINNAGSTSIRAFHEEKIAGQTEMVQVHIIAAMELMHAAIPMMLARGSGAIINVSSVAGFVVSRGSVTYCAAKAFLTSFTESLHLELGHRGIRMQALCPGYTRTDFHERLGYDVGGNFFKGFMSAEYVVDASLRQLSHGAVVCVPGIRYKCAMQAGRWIPRWLLYRLAVRVRNAQKRRERLVELLDGRDKNTGGNPA